MIQQFHLWVYVLKRYKQRLKHIRAPMFTAALLTVAKRRKLPKCVLTDECVDTHHRLFLSFKKEGNSDMCYNMDEA